MFELNNDGKKRVRAIRHAESEALFSSIGDGAISTDEKGVITRINKTALEIIGIQEQQAIGKHLADIYDMVDEQGNLIDASKRPLSTVLKTQDTINKSRHMVKRKRKGDPVKQLEFTISPMRFKDKVIGTIVIFRDVTEEYKIEQMKNDFISLASHQLRTPLSSISTYSHMLVDGFLGEITEKQKNFIKTILKSSIRMNEVISSLTNISKIDNGAVKFGPKTTNVTQILDGVFHENRVAIQEKNITYKNLSDKDNPCIIVNDPILLTEVINNIASNAIKYTEPGGIVTTEAIRTEIGASITIKDSGIGIKDEDQAKIFDKFFRAPGITKHETFGSGLGLYIVKGFLDIIGGSVRFKSIEGEGTTFEVNVPDISNLKMNV